MEKAISQFKMLADNVLSEHKFIDSKKIGVWFKKGNYLDSKLTTSLENDDIDYEITIFINKEENKLLTPHEIFVYLHELSHVVILEKIRSEKGIEEVRLYLDKYNEEIEKLNKESHTNQWKDSKIQEEYEKLIFEKETDLLTKKLFERYVFIASS